MQHGSTKGLIGMIGQLLTGRYLILERLGAGGFGETYLARDKYLPQHPLCVVKCLKPSPNSTIPLETARCLFDTEARVLAHIGGNNSQIPALFAYSPEHDPVYLVQEYVEGEDLNSWLSQDRRFSPKQAIAFLADALPLLSYIHSQGVIHRDIKPSHFIRRQRDGKLALIDFGAAHFAPDANAASQPDNAALAIGTLGYMPDEQHLNKSQFNSDLYALGMVVIHLLTGVHPRQFQPDVISGELDWQTHLRVAGTDRGAPKALDPKLVAILERMVRIKASDRYQRADEVLADLQGLPAAHRTWGRSLSANWQHSKHRLIKPAIALLVLGGLSSKFIPSCAQQAEAVVTQLGQLSPPSQMRLTLLKAQSLPAGIEHVAIASNQQKLITAGTDRIVRLWSLPDLKPLRSLSAHPAAITSLILSPDGKWFVTGSTDQALRLWNLESGALIHTLRAHQKPIAAIAISPDGRTLISGCLNGTLHLWDVESGARLKTFKRPNTEVTAVTYGNTPDRVISASSDRQLQVWDLGTGTLHRTFAGHTAKITNLQVSDNQTLLSFGADRGLEWNLQREELSQVFPENSGQAVMASLRDRHLITVHDNGNIRAWSQRGGRLVVKGAGQLERQSQAALSPDHRYLVSWTADRTLRLWQFMAFD
jgi:serine/threonine protein kinase